MRPEPHHDELHTFRRETGPRRHCRNEGWIRAVAESHCRHDMMTGNVTNLPAVSHVGHERLVGRLRLLRGLHLGLSANTHML